MNSMSSVPILLRSISSSLEMNFPQDLKLHFFCLNHGLFYTSLTSSLLLAFLCIYISSLWLFPAVLAPSLSPHHTKTAISLTSQCSGLATSMTGLAGKRHEATQIVRNTNGSFLCWGSLPVQPSSINSFVDVTPNGFFKPSLISVIINQTFVLNLFSIFSL